MKRSIFILLAIVFSMILPNEISAFSGGLLDGLSGKVSAGNVSSSKDATDNKLSTSVYLRYSQGYIEYTLPGIYHISHVKFDYDHRGSHQRNALRITGYNANRVQVGTVLASDYSQSFNVNWKSVKYIRATNVSTSFSIHLREVNVWGSDASVPSIPTGLKATSDVGKVHLDWNDNSEDFLAGYNVYQNGQKINNELIKESQYTVDPLNPSDQYYSFQVTAVGNSGLESDKSASVKAFSMHEPIIPVLSYTNLKHNSLRLTWSDAKGVYQVYKDGEPYASKTNYRFMDVTGLEPDTEYEFTVESTDRYGRVLLSAPLVIRTEKADQPIKPIVKISDITSDSFKAYWNTDLYTEKFKVYLDGVEITETTGTSYLFEGLEPDKVYTVKIVSYGNSGKTEETTVTTRTKRAPGAEIISASYSGPAESRKINYKPNEYVETVKVFVDGELIGEYPATQTEIELDLSEITEKFANIVLEPTGQNPVPYEIKMPVESLGNDGFDSALTGFMDGFPVLKRAFVFIALLSVSTLLIIVVLFFWIRKKFQFLLKDSNQDKPFSDVKSNSFRQLKKLSKHYAIDPTPDERRVYQPLKRRSNKKGNQNNSEYKVVEYRERIVPLNDLVLKPIKDITYERNGVLYKRNYVKGKGMVYQPKDFKNSIKHVSNQFNVFKNIKRLK